MGPPTPPPTPPPTIWWLAMDDSADMLGFCMPLLGWPIGPRPQLLPPMPAMFIMPFIGMADIGEPFISELLVTTCPPAM